MAILSKTKILNHRQPSKRLWLEINQPNLAVTETMMQACFDVGNQVGALGYDNIEVAGGEQAMLVFAELMNPDLPNARRTSLRESLLSYCERDTLALVNVAHFFATGLDRI